MARAAARYVCQECGAAAPKWSGRCDACGAWNAIVEEAAAEAPPKGLKGGKGRVIELAALKGKPAELARRATGIAEFDRVVGGGLVPGSAILIGGDPGIGKSTLLLQAAAALSTEIDCAYISGEISLNGPVDYRWITPEEIDQYAFPKANHKFLHLIRDTGQS